MVRKRMTFAIGAVLAAVSLALPAAASIPRGHPPGGSGQPSISLAPVPSDGATGNVVRAATAGVDEQPAP